MAEVTGMTPAKISQEITKEINNLKAYATDDIGTGPTNANKFVKLDSEGKIFIATASITGGGDPTNKAYVDKGLNDKADKTHVDNATSNIGNTNSNNANKLVKLNSEGKVFIATASITSGGDPVNKAYVDSLSPLKSFAGAGSPEGKIEAPVGTIYTDTAATNGAIRWIKSNGTGSTGWVVEYGDTGWRDLSSLLPSHMTGTIIFRRQNNWVTLLLTYLTGLTDSVTLNIPDTAVIRAHYMEVAIANAKTTERQLFRVNPGATHVLSANGTNSTANGSVSWVTNSPWPTSLPGTPA